MPTWNKELHSLTLEDIERVSNEYLMGWQDLMANGHGFRVQGLNRMREKYDLPALTKEMSFAHRLNYIRAKFSYDEIYNQISEYLQTARVGDTRWTGIELFDCRFGREYAKFFKELLGAKAYREVSEKARVSKLYETQQSLYGGVGLAGELTKQKAMATNVIRYGGTNVMSGAEVRRKLAETNRAKYGGISPFSSHEVREKALRIKDPVLWAAISEYKKTGVVTDFLCESRFEFQAFKLLMARFGVDDVVCQYGIHPSDKRYPFNCDFYIKSRDLFIELNIHSSHGSHWFDANNQNDVLRLKHLEEHSVPSRYQMYKKVWAGTDVLKREAAQKANLNYLVFWGKGNGYDGSDNKDGVCDFETWFYDYDCDYDSFVSDYPANTY